MSVQPRRRAKHLTAFLFGLGLLLALTMVLVSQTATPTSGTGSGPDGEVAEMRLVITEPAGACVDSDCQLATDQPFTLAVEIVRSPGPDANGIPGYILAQSSIYYGGNITYEFSPAAADEIVWPDCVPVTALKSQNDRRIHRELGDPINNTDEMVSHGCLTGLIPPQPVSEYEGFFLKIAMRCSELDTANTLEMLPYNPISLELDPTIIAGTSGSEFRQFNNIDVVPKLSGLNLFCGTPPTPTPAPTITPGGPTVTPTHTTTPTITPTPTVTPVPATPTSEFGDRLLCGDINGDGRVNAEDALWLLWFSTNMIPSLPNPADVNDVNRDGSVDPLDALFILWIELNLFRCL